jgi:hypothetical protein
MIHRHHGAEGVAVEANIRNKHRILCGEEKVVDAAVGEKFHEKSYGVMKL